MPQAVLPGGAEQHIAALVHRCGLSLVVISCIHTSTSLSGVKQLGLTRSAPAQLERSSHQLATALFNLADAAPIDPAAAVTDTVSNKNGGFFGPLASVFEASLKVHQS